MVPTGGGFKGQERKGTDEFETLDDQFWAGDWIAKSLGFVWCNSRCRTPRI